MTFSTWEELQDSYCSVRKFSNRKDNPFYEEFSNRRYNPSVVDSQNACRLVFLKEVLDDPRNKTLRRKGRFIWCKNLQYEGREPTGLRQISFTVDNGQKRFSVAENNMMSVPAKIYVHNNRFFRSKEKMFYPFSTVFQYRKTLTMMAKAGDYDYDELCRLVKEDCPYKPGTLVVPRLGYFWPSRLTDNRSCEEKHKDHPCGIILGRALVDGYLGREFYRVRFGATTYERVHPVQMEIVNEI